MEKSTFIAAPKASFLSPGVGRFREAVRATQRHTQSPRAREATYYKCLIPWRMDPWDL